MATAETPNVVSDGIEVVSVWRNLEPRIVHAHRLGLTAIDARREGWWHVVRQIQTLEWEVDVLLDLVGKGALEREPFEMDEEDRRETRQREPLRGLAQDLAVGTVPARKMYSLVNASDILQGERTRHQISP